ncbi:hypothetical protein [Nocardia terpenica]|uniref:hypothetical protein n=1 Tax=Nocardia terpenica TaxID=455432 RepID=UPI001E57F00E|nr:hypothetical protein [Nocardia terpenica]
MPIMFDTSGFRQADEDVWDYPLTGDRVLRQYTPGVPTIPAPLEDLPALRRYLAEAGAESGCLIEAHVVSFAGLPALLRFEKMRHWNQPGGLIYTASIIVPRATGAAALLVLCAENDFAGLRDAAIATRVGIDRMNPPHPYAPHVRGDLPYSVGDDAQWDQEFPGHALTRARRWFGELSRGARIDPRFATLPPFSGPIPDFPGMTPLSDPPLPSS